ncbi:MAG: DUF4350 domain-containing protein [Sphingobium sp.]
MGLLFLVLFSGFLPLYLPGGWAVAGVIETGQAQPARWALGYMLGLLALALLLRRMQALRFTLWLAATGTAGSILIFCAGAGASPSWRTYLGWPDAAVSPTRSAKRPVAGVMSALPLFWTAAASPGALLDRARDQAFVDTSSFDLRAIDHLDTASLAGFDTLLLAQPRLLQPAELVALDAWVRKGGRLVVLADPLLVWPGDWPIGDPRRPPLTSLLDPLLAHWGLELEAAGASGNIDRRVLKNGAVLMLAGASRFTIAHKECALRENGLVAVCKLGRGRVRLIADADMIDDRLWLVHGDAARVPAATAADAVALIDGWLLDPTADKAVWPINRVRDDAALLSATRWALLFGVGWIGMGMFALRTWERRGKSGKMMRGPTHRQDDPGT